MTDAHDVADTLPIDALLRARGIENPHQLYRSGGPALQTMRRIYRGETIRQDTLERFASLLDLTPGALNAVLEATRTAIQARRGGR